jgi:hypothetical protein
MTVVAVASFVLLVTVLPQIASSIGLSSLANRLDATSSCSSGVGSSSSVGSMSSSSSSSCCSSSSGSSSSSSSSSCGVTPPPATGGISGTINVTGVPGGVTIKAYTAEACPANDPLASEGIGCYTSYSGPSGFSYGPADKSKGKSVTQAAKSPDNVYDFPSLTVGSWLLYPGYQTIFGSFIKPTGKAVTIAARNETKNLKVPYQTPTSGALTGTVTVLNSPNSDFNEAGVEACTSAPTTTSCPGAQETIVEGSNGQYTLVLAPGTWYVAAFVYNFDNPSGALETLSPYKVKTIAAGQVVNKNFKVNLTS